jgi:4a-hydroxytetrahydrobiopterin dehydratase
MAKYSSEKIQSAMGELKDKWVLDSSKKSISIAYNGNYPELILLANAVAHIANKIDHHPSIGIEFNEIRFTLTSHDVDGLSDRDFKLAHQIEVLHYKPV